MKKIKLELHWEETISHVQKLVVYDENNEPIESIVVDKEILEITDGDFIETLDLEQKLQDLKSNKILKESIYYQNILNNYNYLNNKHNK